MSGDTVVSRRPNSGSSWTNFMARIVMVLCLIVSVGFIVGYSYDLYRHGRKKHLIGWFSSAGFVLLSFLISSRLIVLHFRNWYSPKVQKYVVRIIWLVPLYSVESWLALRFRDQALYIETLRECYESYTLFSFLYFLIALLGEEAHLIASLKEKPDYRGEHFWPLRYFIRSWVLGSEFLHNCKIGVLQYVAIKNLMAAVIFLLQLCRVYDEGQFLFNRGYLYVCIISNASQLWALYCLIKFYVATKEELAMYAPIGKFMCIKFVVFFTWWQSIFVNLLAKRLHVRGVENSEGTWTREQLIMGFQDYLICIEMFVASLAFTVYFSHRDYLPHRSDKNDDDEEYVGGGDGHHGVGGRGEEKPFLSALIQSSLPDDVFHDLRRVVKGQELLSPSVNQQQHVNLHHHSSSSSSSSSSSTGNSSSSSSSSSGSGTVSHQGLIGLHSNTNNSNNNNNQHTKTVVNSSSSTGSNSDDGWIVRSSTVNQETTSIIHDEDDNDDEKSQHPMSSSPSASSSSSSSSSSNISSTFLGNQTRKPLRPFGSWFDSRFGPAIVETKTNSNSSASNSSSVNSNNTPGLSIMGSSSTSGSNNDTNSIVYPQRSVRKLDILVSKSTSSKDFLEHHPDDDKQRGVTFHPNPNPSGHGIGSKGNEIIVLSQTSPRNSIPSITTSPSR